MGKAATTTTVAMEGKEKDQIAMIVIVGEEVKENDVPNVAHRYGPHT